MAEVKKGDRVIAWSPDYHCYVLLTVSRTYGCKIWGTDRDREEHKSISKFWTIDQFQRKYPTEYDRLFPPVSNPLEPIAVTIERLQDKLALSVVSPKKEDTKSSRGKPENSVQALAVVSGEKDTKSFRGNLAQVITTPDVVFSKKEDTKSSRGKSSDSWNPNHFRPLEPGIEQDGQLTLTFYDPNEPPEPDDFQNLDEFEEAWNEWEDLDSLTCAVGLEPDSVLPDCSSDLTSLELQRPMITVQTSSASDSQESITMEMCACSVVSEETLISSLQVHHAPPSQFKESDLPIETNEIASHTLSERSQISSPSFSVSKTFPDCSAQSTTAAGSYISNTFFQSFSSTGTMSNGLVSSQLTLQRPGVGVGCLWLESPGALSSSSNTARPPGSTRLENQLRSMKVIASSEVANPEFLESAFNLPLGWTDPLENRSASALRQEMESLATVELPLAMPLIQESPSSLSSASSTCDRSIPRGISFTKTLDQLLHQGKCCTRRLWSDRTVKLFTNYFERGVEVPAYDKSLRNGGQTIGWLKLTQRPYQDELLNMTQADLEAEGFAGYTLQQFVDEFFDGNANQKPWVIWFEFYPLELENPLEPETQENPLELKPEVKPKNPLELNPKISKASGWLEPYTKNKKLKDGIIATYPRVEYERDPDEIYHWYWCYRWEVKDESAKSSRGYRTKAVQVRHSKVEAVQMAIASHWPVEKILALIKGGEVK